MTTINMMRGPMRMSVGNDHDQSRGTSSGFDAEGLLVLAKAGDGAALGRLLERYRNYVGLLVRLQVGRRLRTKVDIEDLLQEISLEIHRKITLFRGGSEREFLTWARRLIGSILANQVRRLPGNQEPGCTSGASPCRRPGPFVTRLERQPGCVPELPQPASRPPRTSCAAS